MAHRWYVVHVYSGFERKIAQSLREQAVQKGMDKLITDVLVPAEEVVEVRRGSKVNERSEKAVITTGIGMPASICWAAALNSLQNCMMFRPR